MPKEIDVTCPCCSHVLTVDVLTRQVLRTAEPRKHDDTGKAVLDEGRWDKAKERVLGRSDGAGDRLDAALSKERSRDEDLNDLFDKAKRKALGGDASAPEDEGSNPLEGPTSR